MKKLLVLTNLVLAGISAFGQCVIEPFSLQKKIVISDLVIEGTVTSSYSFWDADHHNIYTSNTIMVHKLFDGNLSSETIELITEGGIVGMVMHRSDPSLQVHAGETGIFLLKQCKVHLPDQVSGNNIPDYQPSASVQSFIKYDMDANMAYGYFESYLGIETLLFPKIESYTGKGYRTMSKGGLQDMEIKPLSAPVIDSFSLDTITAGTGSKMTIYGSNFSFARGTSGRVMFTDPDYGDGRFYDELLDPNYVSWSSTKIEVIVPSKAGTGKIKVVNATGESGVSTDLITVLYAHQNVKYGHSGVGIDTGYHQIDLIDINGTGGYSWQFNSTFKSNFNAVNAFLRSMETWRCNTLMNWDIGEDTSLDQTADDDVNIVRWTTFSDSRLGVCWSRFSGCFSAGPVVHWAADELDIEFDKDRNWYYGEGKPLTSQYDFQSVASHELGHGHQMGHVIDTKKMMHYSISIGERKADLHTDDISCGSYIRDKSKVKNPCGPGPLVPVNVNDCNITRPKAALMASRTDICPGDTILFTDMSEGVVNTYAWNFGASSVPATSGTKGPHKVVFTQEGNYNVSLIVTNDFGSDTDQVSIIVKPAIPERPALFAFDTLICTGRFQYTIDSVTRAESYLWTLPMKGGKFVGDTTLRTVTVDWPQEGFYELMVVAVNACGTSVMQGAGIQVKRTVEADFSFVADGRTVTFTDGSIANVERVWRFGDGDTSVEEDPVHEYAAAGTYTVELAVSNECSDDSKTETIQVQWGAGIHSPVDALMKVYPNPAGDFVTIALTKHAGSYDRLELTDIAGRLVMYKMVENQTQVVLDISQLPDGVYMLRLAGQDRISGSYKLIVQNTGE